MWQFKCEEREITSTKNPERKWKELCAVLTKDNEEKVFHVYQTNWAWQIENTNIVCLVGHEDAMHVSLESGEIISKCQFR